MNDLLAYLLKLDEPDERSRTESRLRDDPDAVRELDALRRLIEPLEADRETPEPPPGLVARTIGLVAHHACGQAAAPAACPDVPRVERFERRSPKDLTHVIAALDRRSASPSRWRWADFAVVAAILVVGVGLVLAVVPYVRQRAGVQACQNQLRQLYAALDTYASTHNESFPAVSETPPNNTAASYAAILRESGAMPASGSFGCPAMNLEFGTYAYSLGYRDETGALAGLRRDQGDNDLLPIAGDRPALGRTTPNPDHRSGQNILLVGGNVRFSTTGYAGVAGDDIYRNQELQVRAGVKLWDTVLGVAGDRP